MNNRRFGPPLVAILLTLTLITFQHCSVDSSESGGLSSGSSGPGPTPTPFRPTISLDNNTRAMTAPVAAFNVSGDCNVGQYSTYRFEVSYQENGTTSAAVLGVRTDCVNNRYSLSVNAPNLRVRANFSGVVSIRIVATRAAGDVEGIPAAMTLTWPSTTTGSTTGTTTTTGSTTGTTTTTGSTTGTTTTGSTTGTTTTTGSTTGTTTTTGSTTGTTTGCNVSCSEDRACGSRADTCGGNTCAPKECACTDTGAIGGYQQNGQNCCFRCCAGSYLTASEGWPDSQDCNRQREESGWPNKECRQENQCWYIRDIPVVVTWTCRVTTSLGGSFDFEVADRAHCADRAFTVGDNYCNDWRASGQRGPSVIDMVYSVDGVDTPRPDFGCASACTNPDRTFHMSEGYIGQPQYENYDGNCYCDMSNQSQNNMGPYAENFSCGCPTWTVGTETTYTDPSCSNNCQSSMETWKFCQ